MLEIVHGDIFIVMMIWATSISISIVIGVVVVVAVWFVLIWAGSRDISRNPALLRTTHIWALDSFVVIKWLFGWN